MSPVSATEQSLVVKIAMSPHILTTFKEWTANKPCWDVDTFDAPHSMRATSEVIIICKALHEFGVRFELDIYASPNYGRNLALAAKGLVHLPGSTIWEDDIDQELFHTTTAIVPRRTMAKGIFTLASHPMFSNLKEWRDLTKYTGVTLQLWQHDWQVLNTLTQKAINAPNAESVAKMINQGRADFTLGEFNRDMKFRLADVTLVPIPGFKVVLSPSRHFTVRKGLADSDQVYNALNQGLIALRKKGEIQRLQTATGFHSQQTQGWMSFHQQPLSKN